MVCSTFCEIYKNVTKKREGGGRCKSSKIGKTLDSLHFFFKAGPRGLLLCYAHCESADKSVGNSSFPNLFNGKKVLLHKTSVQ